MKKEYKTPLLNVSLFSENVCTTGSSGIDGTDEVDKGLTEQNINNIEKISLSSFTF